MEKKVFDIINEIRAAKDMNTVVNKTYGRNKTSRIFCFYFI